MKASQIRLTTLYADRSRPYASSTTISTSQTASSATIGVSSALNAVQDLRAIPCQREPE
jgi:hypothetical protein